MDCRRSHVTREARNPEARNPKPRRDRFECSHGCIILIDFDPGHHLRQSDRLRSRRALRITETELKVMAKLAIIGLSRRPKKG
jgi:hypothetical protein